MTEPVRPKYPPEALEVAANAFGMAQKRVWARPGLSLKDNQGNFWSASCDFPALTLTCKRNMAVEQAQQSRKRELEESLQPLLRRKEMMEQTLALKVTDHMRQQYEAELERVTESLDLVRAEIAGLPTLLVDPVSGRRIGGVDTYTFDVSEGLAL